MASSKWTTTIDGVDVDFYIDELQQSNSFPDNWMAYWEVNGTERLEPVFYPAEPSQATVEALYNN